MTTAMSQRFTLRGIIWGALYLLFVLGPLFALLLGRLPPARDFWTEFATAIGYAGLAMMGLQFGLTARFRFVTEPWGEDVIYHFHRQVSLVAVGLVGTHALIMFAVLARDARTDRCRSATCRGAACSRWCRSFR